MIFERLWKVSERDVVVIMFFNFHFKDRGKICRLNVQKVRKKRLQHLLITIFALFEHLAACF
jgi:hypothetical protein